MVSPYSVFQIPLYTGTYGDTLYLHQEASCPTFKSPKYNLVLPNLNHIALRKLLGEVEYDRLGTHSSDTKSNNLIP